MKSIPLWIGIIRIIRKVFQHFVVPGGFSAQAEFDSVRLRTAIICLNPATSISATAHRADRLFRLRKALTKFPPLAVVSAFPVRSIVSSHTWSALAARFALTNSAHLPSALPTGETFASFAPRPTTVCQNPPENNKNTETHEGLPYFWHTRRDSNPRPAA